MEHLLKATTERALRYLDGLDRRSVVPSPEGVTNPRRLDEPLPESPTDPEVVVALLDEIGSPATVATAWRLSDLQPARNPAAPLRGAPTPSPARRAAGTPRRRCRGSAARRAAP